MRAGPIAVTCAVALGVVVAPVAAAQSQRPAASSALTWQQPQHTDPLRGLTSISCVSRRLCRAGDKTDLVLRWNGHEWQQGNQFPADARGIEAMSCTSNDFCAAVEMVNQPNGIAYRPVTRNADDTWDTSSPATRLTRGRYGIDASFPQAALSCTSASFCMLVNQQRGFQRWDGTSWTAPVTFQKEHSPTFVSCASPTMCRAVGDVEGGDKTVYSWNGSAWSDPRILDLAQHIDGLSCATTSFCMMVLGLYYVTLTASHMSAPKHLPKGLYVGSVSCTSSSFCIGTNGGAVGSIRWDGSRWSGPHRIAHQIGLRVSCASPSFCAAVSDEGDAVNRVDGTWQTPRAVEPLSGYPDDVSCGSAMSCVLVDARSSTAAFDGTSWSGPHRIEPPVPRKVVSCVSEAFCAAGNANGTVQFRRDGHWSAQQPAVIRSLADVEAISCTSSTFCAILTSLGAFRVWNGSRWFTIATPAVSGFNTALSCVAGGCVMVAATDASFPLLDQTWIYRMGAKTLDKVGPRIPDFASLSCTSLTFCMGNGDTMQQFDGSSWQDAPTAGGDVSGTDVSCASTSFCVVVGGRSESTWDGTQWGADQLIVDFPIGPDNYLRAVSCRSEICAAVTTNGWTVTAQ